MGEEISAGKAAGAARAKTPTVECKKFEYTPVLAQTLPGY
jgi:hypothetical protein